MLSGRVLQAARFPVDRAPTNVPVLLVRVPGLVAESVLGVGAGLAAIKPQADGAATELVDESAGCLNDKVLAG